MLSDSHVVNKVKTKTLLLKMEFVRINISCVSPAEALSISTVRRSMVARSDIQCSGKVRLYL